MTSVEVTSVPDEIVSSTPAPLLDPVSWGVLSQAATPSATTNGKISLSRINTLPFISEW